MEEEYEQKRQAALRCLSHIGFPSSIVSQVLHELLKAYEGDWTHIEADNYQVLVTAVLDSQNDGSVPSLITDDNEAGDGNLQAQATQARDGPSQMETGDTEEKCEPAGNVQDTGDVKKTRTKRKLVKKSKGPEQVDGRKAKKSTSGNAEEMIESKSPSANKNGVPVNSESKKPRKRKADVKHPTNSSMANGASPSSAPNDPGSSHAANGSLAMTIYTGGNAIVDADGRKWVKKDKHELQDISKGAEPLPIPFVKGEGGDDTLPKDFSYISTSIIYERAEVNIALTKIGDNDCCSNCFGNCLKKKWPCSCTHETGGEYAYTPQGCLREKFLAQALKESKGLAECQKVFCEGVCPMELVNEVNPGDCKGHILRKFVKECWSKCTCHRKLCGNRVVQNGVKHHLEVFWTNNAKGWGVRTKEDLPKGAFVCEYVGEILTNSELYERNKTRPEGRHTYPMILNADICTERILDDDTLLCLDATNFGNVARFINHRCEDANLVDVPVQIETPDRHYYHVAFFTTRAVQANEELTWDYQIDFEDNDHPIKAFKCKCQSPYCRQP